MPRIAYLLTLFLTVSGCFLAGPRDGMFKVVGSAPIDGSCRVEVSAVGSKSQAQKRSVFGTIHESFVIGPSRKGHIVSLYCGQSEIASKVVKYGRDVSFGGEVTLIDGAH